MNKIAAAFAKYMFKYANGADEKEEAGLKDTLTPEDKQAILDYIQNTPGMEDEQYHKFVEDRGILPHAAETYAYSVLSELLNNKYDPEGEKTASLSTDIVKLAYFEAISTIIKASMVNTPNQNPSQQTNYTPKPSSNTNSRPAKIEYPNLQVNYTSKDGLLSIDSPNYATDLASRVAANAGGGTARNANPTQKQNTRTTANYKQPEVKNDMENNYTYFQEGPL